MLHMRSARSQRSRAERIAEVILEHAARISQETDLTALIRLYADLARDLICVERCSLWLVDERSGYFFFQAEDGIRDRNVTGVQTCALSRSRVTPSSLPTSSKVRLRPSLMP